MERLGNDDFLWIFFQRVKKSAFFSKSLIFDLCPRRLSEKRAKVAQIVRDFLGLDALQKKDHGTS